jgi:hypothetical protein
MNYLIQPKDSEPFFTNWFIAKNNYEDGMIVYDLMRSTYTTNGIDWKPIATDHL